MTHLSEKELAARWRVSSRFIRQMRYERRIDFLKLGRRVVYPVAFVERFERENTVAARPVTIRRFA